MGQIKPHRPVLSIVAVFSRYPAAIDWARERIERDWGPIALASDEFIFDDTPYYERSMGPDLKKRFFAGATLMDPGQLAARKLLANAWESEYQQSAAHPEPRPLNLDPGYLTEAKLVLASTKDREQRLYLGDGIYAECTLQFQSGAWREQPWTYPDYRRAEYHAFFDRCREYLRARYRE